MKTAAFAPKTPEHGSGAGKRISAGVVASVLAFAYMCSKQAGRVSKKLKPSKPMSHHSKASLAAQPQSPYKSPLNKPKQLLTTISNKAITFIHKKKPDDDEFAGARGGAGAGDWGDGGVWQRSILMGDKCQPLDFSGVIYYDSNGKQMSELPLRSPRASPLPGYLERLGK
ncbi:Transmembrane protein [Trema orientale]|uniref:Transmembrane protein n=1 Tax=Trema orientale TaxID=63057 RepID=A0A2P5ELU5_TREOI|nr:Transmembrane protein [Trema orientale]